MINLIPKRKKSNAPPQAEMTFFEHIDALRPHLVRIILVLFSATIGAFFFKGFIIDTVLFGPQSADFITNRVLCRLGTALGIEELCVNQLSFNIVNTRMSGQFSLHMTVSMVTGIVVTVPFIIWELWKFIKPALTASERRGGSLFVLYVSLCFFSGLCFGYFVIAPLTVNFLSGYAASDSIVNMIDVGSYLSTVINVAMACAIVFQLPVLVYFLSRMGIVSSRFMKKYRRHAVVVMVIFAAIITPPDIFSQVLVALPLLALYELSINIASKIERRKERDDMVSYNDFYGKEIES